MATDLRGVALKLDRADAHLAELGDAIEKTLNASGEHFTCKFDPKTGYHVYRAHGLPAIGPEWSVVIGELLYDLRSALDHLAWQLVLLDGGTPGEQTQFPVLESPFNKKGQLVAVQLKPPVEDPKILAALDKAQPYKGPEGEPARFDINPLWQLHRLNIIDKHRLLLVVVCVLNPDEMYWAGDPAMPVPKLKIATGPLDEGSEVAWFDWGNHDPPPRFDPHLALAVAIDEPAIVGQRATPIPLVKVLGSLCNWVRWDVFELGFRGLFPA
jgi:hypothetical protein